SAFPARAAASSAIPSVACGEGLRSPRAGRRLLGTIRRRCDLLRRDLLRVWSARTHASVLDSSGRAVMKQLANLVGQPWLDAVVADTRRRGHPLHFPATQQGPEWSQWREVFDSAVGVVVKLLENNPPGRDRLVAKIKDRRQFWSTVPEIVWAARLARLGMQVDVEPIVGRSGPDMRFTWDGFTAHAEVYSPVFEADEFSWADDLQEDLERLNVGYHVSCQLLPDRLSENRSTISKTLRRVISTLQARNDPTPLYR